MRVKVSRTSVEGEVFAPPSKSYTHRAITIGSLSEKCVVRRPLISEDTKATIRACKMLGAHINEEKGDLFIEGVKGKPHIPEDVIDVGNSGTTLRFMTAVASLVDGVSILTGDNSLRTRPNGPLIEVLHDLGAEVISTLNNGCAPLVVKGGLKGAIAKIDGSISSQFISALLIACPLTSQSTTLSIKGELRSKPYVNVTLEILREAGAEIFEDSNHNIKFIIPPNQDYDLKDYLVPGDFSSASYLLAAAAMTGSRVVVKNMFPSQQGDMAIIDILKQMGAGVSWDKENGVVTVNGRDLKGVRVDAAATPDLVPTIAVLGAVAEGQTVIENAEHVRYKETDRLHAMAVELKKMGVSVKEDRDQLTIKGGKLKGGDLHGWHDHRIVMALTIAGMVAGDTTVDTAESIFISYPNFFDDIRSLGADVVVNKQ
ncbi:3-phosphoshikimate 1-carboxyvinyltransferase [Methanohalophilus portucalensis]|uniref:3-phosphoshikimate 1-carboxyvinyltransferase n=2 Tax=Methanohalophilus portucalensis TaxID=39664 RepID=A0A1L9C6I0_9EURY|nr:3-phosphoshikimate 1-carboxyvinyltransferase [Methanohalophilus portucalensis]ATU08697.1 3-phosphoshikimate 1-carboxyvinyltransferase [Methanohalophilus portucalensis]OJH50084.1 3-phosphoshikimate 1-carboxyvinyltransferase [Methanohalophilus portucalensis FDF-1]RNI13129.1 3-phosphoshikimate 1-carboxyvinyltransferase [Methanohalophilus portucalensis FDF-1]SMH31542.1 3-phosphoshikimate 1-carboxyvinyltransferase [Methanohalophilus portucalensis FDF-1]